MMKQILSAHLSGTWLPVPPRSLGWCPSVVWRKSLATYQHIKEEEFIVKSFRNSLDVVEYEKISHKEALPGNSCSVLVLQLFIAVP